MSTSLHLEKDLSAPPERVFSAFVDADDFRRWFGPVGFTVQSLQLEALEGADYRLTMQPPEGDVFRIRGTFRTVDPPRRLAFTFEYEEPDPDDVETLVEVLFEPADGGTRIILDQGPFTTEQRWQLHQVGWTETLKRLEQSLAA